MSTLSQEESRIKKIAEGAAIREREEIEKRLPDILDALENGSRQIISKLEVFGIFKVRLMDEKMYVQIPTEWALKNSYRTLNGKHLLKLEVQNNTIVAGNITREEITDMIRGLTIDITKLGIICPVCSSEKVSKVGIHASISQGARQRYICNECGKTFYEE